MKLTLDTAAARLSVEEGDAHREMPLYSPEAFRLLSRQWLRVGWSLKYSYSFTWLGRPVIQIPEDLIRIQEVIAAVRPDVIIETGIAHGGSLVFYAGLCRLLGRGRVIGVDADIRPAVRTALAEHPLADLLTPIEGDSAAPDTLARVKDLIRPGETVLAVLDSGHDRAHVAAELEAYAPLVTHGSYIVAADGITENLADVPRGRADWTWNNPSAAVRAFVAAHPDFVREDPPRAFDEGEVPDRVTYWPGAFLRRRAQAAD